MSRGYTGRVLFVDLTKKLIKEEQLTDITYRSFIGGAGLGARILYERMSPKADPLGPENMFGFMAGLLTGTNVAMAPRSLVVTKSPLTGTWADSNAGGYFGHELKTAGYDAVFFSGISPKPVYLLVNDDKAELRDASGLWGKDTYETQDSLRQEIGDKSLRVARIGPAGESLSLLASVVWDDRIAARQGVGAVMGAKKLKAVAVRGSRKVEVADPDRFSAIRKAWLKDLSSLDDKPFLKGITKWGTCNGLSSLIIAGGSPIKNWSLIGAEYYPDHAKLNGDNVTKYQEKKSGCFGCPIACGGVVTVPDGPFQVSKARKPEYETQAGFGPMCLNTDVEALIKANYICDVYGMDTISAGNAVAFAMECYEKGLIGKDETDGVELTWGNASALVTMIEKIGKREGFGAVLADGVQRASEKIGKGSDKFAIHIHGQEPGYHDPRLYPVRGLGYIGSPRQGRHGEGMPAIRLSSEKSVGPYPELKISEAGDRYEDIARMHALANSYFQAFSDSGMCQFAFTVGTNFPLAEAISAATGWDFTTAEAIAAGRRINTLRHAFNMREGLTAKEVNLPDRIAEPPTTGPFTGRSIDFDALRSAYFVEMGWGAENGRPSQACLNDLGLQELVQLD